MGKFLEVFNFDWLFFETQLVHLYEHVVHMLSIKGRHDSVGFNMGRVGPTHHAQLLSYHW